MDSINIFAKLGKLKANIDRLTKGDGQFVEEMFNLQARTEMLTHQQALRIIDLQVPGEPNQLNTDGSTVWTCGMLNVVCASPDETIWRYMPLEHLFALLSNKALHFSPLAVMNDKTAGTLPPQAWEDTKEELPQSVLDGRSAMDADTMLSILVEQRRTDACINCWSMNTSESLQMWQDYAPKNGVAIQSTVGRLASCFSEDQTITVSPVSYFTPEEEARYSLYAFIGLLFNKHVRHKHERELRALAYRVNNGGGCELSITADQLIERLVLSPELRDWAVPFITEAIRKFGFDGTIEKSSLPVR